MSEIEETFQRINQRPNVIGIIVADKEATHIFWDDSFYDRNLLPLESSLANCPHSLADLATMTGKERIDVFKQCGINPIFFPLFLRSLQHITALHAPGSIEDNYIIHPHMSARYWDPLTYNPQILGYSTINSESYREKIPNGISRDVDIEIPASSNKNLGIYYNGLLNQGATCYLNSLLQSLYHISAFRSIIYQMPTAGEADELNKMDFPKPKSIPYALQRLFCMLQTTTKAVGTTELTESFGWSEADSFIQHDVHELTRVLLDNLESKLTKTLPSLTKDEKGKNENAIYQLFTGFLENYVKVEEMGYYGARTEPFYDLQLVVKNTNDIYSSFDTLFQVEVLDGKNKYCFEQNGKKTYHRAEKGVLLKVTPPILLLHLTRFDYDIDQGESKIFSRWDYYSTIDLSRYMPHVPAADAQYTLCSVLVHSGSNAGFGHYYCFVLCSGSWYKFNDESVTPASLMEVFYANFGGNRLNYWGSEMPRTTTAYMLVYIRTSQMASLLKPIGPENVPKHVIDQLCYEKREELRITREREEDYLYGRIYFIQPQDIVGHETVLTSRRLPFKKPSSSKTLRVLLEADALSEFRSFTEKFFGYTNDEQLFWYADLCTSGNVMRLGAQVKAGMRVKAVLDGANECCVLVTSTSKDLFVEMATEAGEFELFHHKLYDPLQLKLLFIGSIVIHHDPLIDPKVLIEKMEAQVRQIIAMLPNDALKLHKHHLKFRQLNKLLGASLSNEVPNITLDASCQSISSEAVDAVLAPPPRGFPIERLTLLKETEDHGFGRCDTLCSGDVLVWQLETPPEERENVFYPDVIAFQNFLQHRIPVEIRLNQAPTYPVLIKTELADNMKYEQLQRYIARLIGEVPNYDRIRFTRHNPETDLPYYMKGKKRDRPTLARLLTPASRLITTFSTKLYYEYCKFTVAEIECSHSLQFKLYNNNVKAVSAHWILLPREEPITVQKLFHACVREIQRDYALPLSHRIQNEDEATETSSASEFQDFIMNLVPTEAWSVLRLVDVWRGKIYNVFDCDHQLVFEQRTFEESAEYRVERIPQPTPDVSLLDQSLIQVQHFTLIRQRKDPVETHSEPFSIYILHNELPNDFLRRIASKLQMSYAAVVDWKVCLVKENRVVVMELSVPMGPQLEAFCEKECYQPNQKEPLKIAFVGLEHAPVTKRTPKRSEKVVILN